MEKELSSLSVRRENCVERIDINRDINQPKAQITRACRGNDNALDFHLTAENLLTKSGEVKGIVSERNLSY